MIFFKLLNCSSAEGECKYENFTIELNLLENISQKYSNGFVFKTRLMISNEDEKSVSRKPINTCVINF